MAKKRMSPKSLVANSAAKLHKRNTWFDKLGNSDRYYILSVIKEMKENPGASAYLISKALKEELVIRTSETTIARTLKELLNDKAQS